MSYFGIPIRNGVSVGLGSIIPLLSGGRSAPVEGWHVNVRHTEKMPELKAWAVTPKTPSHVWV